MVSSWAPSTSCAGLFTCLLCLREGEAPAEPRVYLPMCVLFFRCATPCKGLTGRPHRFIDKKNNPCTRGFSRPLANDTCPFDSSRPALNTSGHP
jgi:hypothetical protein